MSAVDTLKTVLVLEQKVSGPAKDAQKAVKELGDEAEKTEKDLDGLGGKMGDAGNDSDLLDRASQALGGTLKGLGTTIAKVAVSFVTGGAGGIIGGIVKLGVAVFTTGMAVGAFSKVLSGLGVLAQTIAPIAAQGFGLALAFPILDKLKGYDSTRRVFSAVLGDRSQAKQMTDFIEQYGLTSNFGQTPLTEVSKTLLLGGQDVNRFLPVAETIGLFGGGTDEAMLGVADVFKRLMGGQIADAFGPDGFGRFGINKQMLESAGATFNKQGQFEGGIDDALKVLETLTQTHQAMKGIRQEMQGSVAAVTSNFFDAIDKGFRLFSERVASKAIPLIENLTQSMINLANSGVPEMLGDMFNDVFGLNGKMAGSFDHIAAGFLATIETAIILGKAGFEFVINAFKSIDPALKEMQKGLWLISPLGAAGVEAGRRLMGNAIKDLPETLTDPGNIYGKSFNKFYGALTTERAKGPGEKIVAPGGKGENELKKEQEKLSTEQNEHLMAIRQNTRIMAEAAIQRTIFGGGQVGELGITPYDRSVMQGRSTGSPVEKAVRDLVSAITEDTSLRLSGYDNMIRGRA